MMICSKCGAEINESDKVCANCKTPVQLVTYEFDMSVTDLFDNDKHNDSKDTKYEDGKHYGSNIDSPNRPKDKKVKKSAIVAMLIGILLIFPVLFIILKINDNRGSNETVYNENVSQNQSDNINHNVEIDYTENTASGKLVLDKNIFEFNFSNYNGYGTVYATADVYKVYDVLMPIFGYTELNIDTREVMSDVYKNIHVDFSENSNLSNDQVITAYITIDESCLRKYGIDYKTTECEIVVTGLKEIKDIDLFENLYIETVEKDGVVSVVWEYNGDYSAVVEQSLECEYPDGSSFGYGDKFLISVKQEELENLKQTYGLNPVVLQKEYILLENNYEYMSDIKDISDGLIKNLENQDLKTLKKNTSNIGINFSSCQRSGSFLYSFDGSENYGLKNCLVLIYKVNQPYQGTDIDSIYVWIAHFEVVQNTYGFQKCLFDNTDMAYPTIYYNVEKGEYMGVYIEDTLKNVKDTYNMKDERISYDSDLINVIYNN